MSARVLFAHGRFSLLKDGGMDRATGIDISHWNGKIDFAKAKSSGAEFVYIKSSQACWTDDTWVRNWQAAKAAGILRGAYHYLDFTRPALDQAKYFAALLKMDPGELPAMLDFEEDPNGLLRPDVTRIIRTQMARDFLAYVEQTLGRIPGIYTGDPYWRAWGSPDQNFAKYPFWLAAYVTEANAKIPLPWTRWTIWQYTSSANGPAYGADSAKMDLNWFNGTREDLYKFANVPLPTHPAICPTCGQAWPLPAPIPPTPQPNTYHVNVGLLNVRSLPNGIVIGTIARDTKVVVDQVDYQWAHFLPQAGFIEGGWVWLGYLTKVA
jgi:lysozyme